MMKLFRYALLGLFLVSGIPAWSQDTAYTAEQLIEANEEQEDQEEAESESNTTYADEADSDTLYFNQISASGWQKIKEDKDFIYNKPKTKVQKTKRPPDLSWITWLWKSITYILFAVVGGLVLFILYYIFKNSEFSYFNKRKKEEEIPSGTYEDVFTYSEWDKALQDALLQRNYRLAVRILYLQTLQKLHLENFIRYEQEKTNWDYVNQLQQPALRPGFTQLTKYFDYIWYGHFQVDEKGYADLEKKFKQFQTGI